MMYNGTRENKILLSFSLLKVKKVGLSPPPIYIKTIFIYN